MKIENVFVAFLNNDSIFCEHLIYKDNDKFIDLITDKEINYSDIDLKSIRKYSGNKADNILKEYKNYISDILNINEPLFLTKKALIRNYLYDRNQFIDLNKWAIKYRKHEERISGYNYNIITDKIGIYLIMKDRDYKYYDLYTGEILEEKDWLGSYENRPYVSNYKDDIEDIFNGKMVLKKDFIKKSYLLTKSLKDSKR